MTTTPFHQTDHYKVWLVLSPFLVFSLFTLIRNGSRIDQPPMAAMWLVGSVVTIFAGTVLEPCAIIPAFLSSVIFFGACVQDMEMLEVTMLLLAPTLSIVLVSSADAFL